MKAHNDSLTVDDREALRTLVRQLFMDSSHEEHLRNMRAVTCSVGSTVPTPYGESGVEIVTWANEGKIETAGFGGELEHESVMENSDKEIHVVLQFPENITESIGSGSLVIQLEVAAGEGDFLAYSEGSKYKAYRSKEKWIKAEDHCQSQGGHLASLLSAWDEKEIISSTADNNMTNIWLGGRDEEGDGLWTWSDGSPWGHPRWNWPDLGSKHPEYKCIKIDVSENKKAKNRNIRWTNRNCNNKRPYVCAAYPGILKKYNNMTIKYTKQNLTFPYFEMKFKMTARTKETQTSGFKLTWFIETAHETNIPNNTHSIRDNNLYHTKMANMVKKARYKNMKQDEIKDMIIQEKIKLLQTGNLNYETMCFGGLIKEENYMSVFEGFNIEPRQESAFQEVSEDDIKLGKDLFVSMVFCPVDAIKPYIFLDWLLATQSPRTIIKAIVNTLQSSTFSKYVSDKSNFMKTKKRLNQLYSVLDNIFNFQLGNILLATEQIPNLESMRDQDLPYFADSAATLDLCPTGTMCEGIWNQVEGLGNTCCQ